MAKEKTLCLIKPDAVKANHIGEIIAILESQHFSILKMKLMKMNLNLAEKFYNVHKGKPFFDELVKFMTSGEIVALVLERENAIGKLREIVGNTDSNLAEDGTIRNKFGTDKGQNAIHASDAQETANYEISVIFGK